jgi:hypothetical protein
MKVAPTNKIVQQGSWLIGACGIDRVSDIVQYAVKYPIVPKTLNLNSYDELMKFMISKVIPSIRDVLQVEKSLWDEHGVAEVPDDSSFILVTHGRSFEVSETLGVTLNREYAAVGSGTEFAYGYLAQAWKDLDWVNKHDKHAVAAVQSAIKHDLYCANPIMAYKSYSNGEVAQFRKGVGQGVVSK